MLDYSDKIKNKETFLINEKLVDILNKTKNNKKKLKISIITAFTNQLIENYINFLFEEKIEIQFLSYGNSLSYIDHGDEIIYFKPDYIFVFLELENLVPNVYSINLHFNGNLLKEINNLKSKLTFSLKKFQKKYDAPIFFSNFVNTYDDFQKFCNFKIKNSREKICNNANEMLVNISNKINNFYIFDFFSIVKKNGLNQIYDYKQKLIDLRNLNNFGLKILSIEIFKYISQIKNKRKKVIVVDFDNTLWGGILGEDGYENIKIEDSYPGNCFIDFQKYLLNLKNSGVLLCAASKNNLSDVKELFVKRKNDLILKLSDFSALEVHWDDKYKSLINISKKLNLGIDSFVFVDDSKIECEKINKFLPEVKTICLDVKPEEILEKINQESFFYTFGITKEDKKRSQFYKAENKRMNIINNKKNLNFISDLKMVLNISKLKKENLERAVQLNNRTNQFNLTTIRYDQKEILKMIDSKEHEIFCASLRDKFGAYGMISLVFIKKIDKSIHIENFLMSCRALGRKVESAFLSFLEEKYKKNGFLKVIGKYKKSKKNVIVKNFFIDHKYLKKGTLYYKDLSKLKKNKYFKEIRIIYG